MSDTELKYFKDSWKPDYSKFKYSGWALLDKIKDTDMILDIGCGYNLFKEKLGDRVWGIDPANDNADQKISWEDYQPFEISGRPRFNVYLILGSLNFGSEETVEAQIKKLSDITQSGDRIYWRQNPGTGGHPWQGVQDVQFYPWTMEKNEEWANKYQFAINEIKQDSGDRIYAEWIRN